MILRFAFTVFIFLLLLSDVRSQTKETKTIREVLSPTALVEWETAYAFNDQTIQKSELIVKPEFNVGLTKNIKWVILGRFYAEFTDHLEPGRPDQSEVSKFSRRWVVNDRLEAELREFYFDIKIRKTFVTVGKQQMVWGKADGLRIMDVVNPFNFREFLLDEFEDSRIPLWAVKVDLPIKSLTLQMLWIPDQTYHDLADPEATYAFVGLVPNDSTVSLTALEKPDRMIKDSDLGLRLSTFKGGWDLTLNYLYGYDDFPTYFQSVSSSSAVTISPQYTRNHLLGTTFSKAFGSFTLRGELGYFHGKYFRTTAVGNELSQSDQIMSVAGLDYTGTTNTTLSYQLFADRLSVNAQFAGRERLETTMSFLVTRTFLNETLTTDLIWVQSLNRTEGFAQAKIKYLLQSNLSIWAGGELIYGPRSSFIGQFDQQDRVYVGMELGF